MVGYIVGEPCLNMALFHGNPGWWNSTEMVLLQQSKKRKKTVANIQKWLKIAPLSDLYINITGL